MEFKRLSEQCIGSVSGELLGVLSTELRARFAAGGPVQLFTPWVTM